MELKKKILIISYNYPPDISAGAFRIHSLVKELSKCKNIIVHLVTTYPNRYKNHNPNILTSKNYDNIKITRIKNLTKNTNIFREIINYLYFFLKTIFLVKKNKYDLIFSTSSRLFTGFLGSIISKIYNIPHYLDIRDIFLDTLRYSNKVAYYSLYFIIKNIESFTLRQTVHVNLVSEGFKEYFIKYIKKKIYLFLLMGLMKYF